MPSLILDDTDQNWVLALANAIYAADRRNSLRNLAELLLRTKIQASKPELNDEDLDEAVSDELYDLVVQSYSDSAIYHLMGLIRDSDADVDTWLFGEADDYVSSILIPDYQLHSVAQSVYSGYREYLSVYPERVPATFAEGILRYPPPEDEEELERMIIDDLADMIRDRRASALTKLIKNC